MTTRNSNINIFVGPKACRAIPITSHLRRDFLIQCTLDGSVRRIEYHPSVNIDGAAARVDAIIIDSDEGRHAVDFTDTRPAFDPTGERLMQLAFAENCTGIMCVTREDVRREPRFSAARRVWRDQRTFVCADDRMQILAALENEGPVPVRALYGLVDTSRDVREIVYAMACGAELDIDLRATLDDRAIVRLGSRCPPAAYLSFGT